MFFHDINMLTLKIKKYIYFLKLKTILKNTLHHNLRGNYYFQSIFYLKIYQNNLFIYLF
jgi:hypothetical protein